MKRKLLLGCVIVISILSSACHTDRASNNTADFTQEPYSNQEESQEGNQTENASPPEKASGAEDQSPISPAGSSSGAAALKFDIKALKNLDADTELISSRYFKAGDVRSAISFSLTQDWRDSGRLTCDFLSQDNQYESFWNGIAQAAVDTESGKMDYSIIPEFHDAAQEKGTCSITFYLNDAVPHITVDGDARLEGDYYSFQRSFSRPEVFTRYLSKADLYLYPTEDLWLLRNEIYAAHGRKFDSEVLSQYFSNKVWYRSLLDPDKFSDSLLSDIEKKNITLIRGLEEEPFDKRNIIDGIDYAGEWDRLPLAPYLSYLHTGRETGLSADLTKAKDVGVYYSAPGTISVPAFMTQEQFSAVQNGGEAEVVLNALTGESQLISLDPNAGDSNSYGYLMYDKGTTPFSQGSETGVIADLENGTYTLWQTSADTVMKTVYEGDIYILKGAVTGAYTSLAEASKTQTEICAGASESGGETEALADSSVLGNALYYNSKGYFTAVYYLGD